MEWGSRLYAFGMHVKSRRRPVRGATSKRTAIPVCRHGEAMSAASGIVRVHLRMLLWEYQRDAGNDGMKIANLLDAYMV